MMTTPFWTSPVLDRANVLMIVSSDPAEAPEVIEIVENQLCRYRLPDGSFGSPEETLIAQLALATR